MSREKQIEEMAKLLCGMKNGCDNCMWDKTYCNERSYAVEIYNSGYRKQSGWISVNDRLPNEHVRVLVYIVSNHIPLKIDTDRLRNGKFVRWGGDVTHWTQIPDLPTPKER